MPHRASLVAGHFYDADPVRLRAAIQARLGSTPTRLAQLGIAETQLPAILENLAGNAQWFGLAETYTPDVLADILKRAL